MGKRNGGLSAAMLILLLASALGAEETIDHKDGSSWSFPGRSSDGEYHPSSSDTLTSSKPRRRSYRPGFFHDLRVRTAYGTFVHAASPAEIDALLARHRGKIDSRLTEALRFALADRLVFWAFEELLAQGGRVEAWGEGGHFDKDKKLISIGLSAGNNGRIAADLAPSDTFFHELLHFVFYQYATPFSEAKSLGGADHVLIAPLEDRFAVVGLLRKRKSPVGPSNEGLNGFTKEGSLKDLVASAANPSQRQALRKLVESSAFVTNYVHSGIVRILSTNAYGQDHPGEMYTYTPGQIQDVAFLNAYNAVILQQALRLALALSNKPGARWQASFASDGFQRRFESFLRAFVLGLESDPGIGVERRGRLTMDAVLSQK